MSDVKLLLGNEYIKGILKGVGRRGYDPEKILEKAGIPPQVYRDPNSHIDGRQFRNLWRTITLETDDIFLGFLEQPGRLALEREQFKARIRCTTLGEAARVSTQFREAVRNDISYEYLLDDKHHEFTLGIHYQLRDAEDEHLFYWHRLTLIYRYYCWLIGMRIKLNRVCFASPRPDYCVDYRQLFNCDVQFNQVRNSLSFDQKYLHYPVLPKNEEDQLDYMEKYPDWFEMPEEDRSWAGQVERALVHLQREGTWTPTIEDVAEVLGLGARSLRRQLMRENETFMAIKARVRRDVAIKMLVTTDLPVTVIANQIGFREPGDFTRAFINWTGQAPSAFRAQHRTDKALIAAYTSRISSQERGDDVSFSK